MHELPSIQIIDRNDQAELIPEPLSPGINDRLMFFSGRPRETSEGFLRTNFVISGALILAIGVQNSQIALMENDLVSFSFWGGVAYLGLNILLDARHPKENVLVRDSYTERIRTKPIRPNSKRDLMQRTAKEQDILDGGTGRLVYFFTSRDARELDWGEREEPDNNIRHLFKL